MNLNIGRRWEGIKLVIRYSPLSTYMYIYIYMVWLTYYCNHSL